MHKEPGRRSSAGTRCISFLFIIILSTFITGSPVRAESTQYIAALLSSARDLRLHEDPYWHILLHYKKSRFGVKSIIDDPRFFLAHDGKTNPASELEATIRAFFEVSDDDKDSAICRFTARYEWLREKLNLDPGSLPLAECRAFTNFLEANKPESVTLVFPMAHLNSPASMFGHTLLTIETENKTKLLAYSVSYSAHANETFGPLFAFKGLFGLYPGYFSVQPYYSKLQEYSDVDHRDIWEYPLNLTEPEIRRMMLHIRELDYIASEYYFFDENCSYFLFFLLEAARPSVKLTDKVHGWLIPLDSIRMIADQGLIKGADYRPSRTTKIKYLASSLDAGAKARALSLSQGKGVEDLPETDDTSDPQSRKTYELAGEYLQYLYTKHLVLEKEYQSRYLGILKARSRLGVSTDEQLYQIKQPARPDRGHRSNKLGLGFGARDDDEFGMVKIRPAYHDLMDSDDGYVAGAQLIFTELSFRYYSLEKKVRLEGLDLIDIVSLTPRDDVFHPVSWKIKTGLTRLKGKDDEDHLVYEINPGGGIAYKNPAFGLTYAMLETGIHVGGVLEYGYNAGIGGSAGLIKCPTNFWKIHITARDIYFCLGDSFNLFEAALQNSFTIHPHRSISVDVKRRKTRGFYDTEAHILLNLFF